jgi:phosphoenolpyruvate carboxylase
VQAYRLARAFAFYFELINLAETNHRKRRRLSLQLSGEAQRGSLRGTLRAMRAAGISGEEAVDWLRSISIIPVFTAHPTEIARRVVMFKRRRIADSAGAAGSHPALRRAIGAIRRKPYRRDHRAVGDR